MRGRGCRQDPGGAKKITRKGKQKEKRTDKMEETEVRAGESMYDSCRVTTQCVWVRFRSYDGQAVPQGRCPHPSNRGPASRGCTQPSDQLSSRTVRMLSSTCCRVLAVETTILYYTILYNHMMSRAKLSSLSMSVLSSKSTSCRAC